MKIFNFILIAVLLLVLFYFLGPKPAEPILNKSLPVISSTLTELDAFINKKEAKIEGIKPNNEAKIVWFDSTKKEKTPYSIVYIHGFSASQMEGDPVHRNFAKRYGANLYLSRMAGHGVDVTENFKTLTADQLLETAREAVAIGKKLGERVILIGTSAGGALSLQMAAENPDLAGLILYSPCIEIFNKSTRILDDPWGLEIGKAVARSEFLIVPEQESTTKQFWTKKYHLNGVIALENLIEATMIPENFAKITLPIFMGYYFKDEALQDNVVSVAAMLTMFEQLGTAEALKTKKAFPATGDHVIASSIKSKDWQQVQTETYKFAEDILKLTPISKQ